MEHFLLLALLLCLNAYFAYYISKQPIIETIARRKASLKNCKELQIYLSAHGVE